MISKEKYHEQLAKKLNHSGNSNKTYWSILKTFFNSSFVKGELGTGTSTIGSYWQSFILIPVMTKIGKIEFGPLNFHNNFR